MSRIRTNIITNRMVDGAPVASTGLVVTGVCTATSFSGSYIGDGSQLTGISGFATALSSDQSSLLNQIFKTNREASISAASSQDVLPPPRGPPPLEHVWGIHLGAQNED